MRNITFSAEDGLIEAARRKAAAENTTLNEEFRRWLALYAGNQDRAEAARRVIAELRKRIDTSGQKFTRDEMNER